MNRRGTQNLIFTSILHNFKDTQFSLLMLKSPFHFWYSHKQIKVWDSHNLRSFLTFYYHMNYPTFTMFCIHSFCLRNFILTSQCGNISVCTNITFYYPLKHHHSTMYREISCPIGFSITSPCQKQCVCLHWILVLQIHSH